MSSDTVARILSFIAYMYFVDYGTATAVLLLMTAVGGASAHRHGGAFSRAAFAKDSPESDHYISHTSHNTPALTIDFCRWSNHVVFSCTQT